MGKRKAPIKGQNKYSIFSKHYNTSKTNQPNAIQREVIKTWLLKHKRLTTLQAREILGIMHPAGRIKELRELGWNILLIWQKAVDSSGQKHKQGCYVLLSDKRAF